MESAREGDAGLRHMPAFTLAEYQTAPQPSLPQPVASLSVSSMVCRGRSPCMVLPMAVTSENEHPSAWHDLRLLSAQCL